MTWLGEQQIADMARGAAILGSGGGGASHFGSLLAFAAVRGKGPVKLLAPYEVPDDALVIPTAMMGSPTVMDEKIPAWDTLTFALRALEGHLGRHATALMPMEVGGRNCLVAVAVAAATGLPLVDGDGFGRALPELQMLTFSTYGVPGCPFAIANERGDHAVIEALDNLALERLARAVTLQYGGVGYVAGYAMPGWRVKETAVLYTLSLAGRLGHGLRQAGTSLPHAIQALQEATANSTFGKALVLALGKVTAVERWVGDGYGRGRVTIRGPQRGSLVVHFQNEYLLAESDGQVVASVPDILVLLDAETIQPLSTEEVCYGHQVVAMAVPAPGVLRTSPALGMVGPRCFGYDADYRPAEDLNPHEEARGGEVVGLRAWS